jgi:hypothetical protein
MGLGKHGVPLFTIQKTPPRELWSVRRAALLEAGAIVEVTLPRDEAWAMGLLTREKYITRQDKVMRLPPVVAQMIADEKRAGEESIGPAIQRLWERKVLPRRFDTPQTQRKALEEGAAWMQGMTEAQKQQEGDAATIARNQKNARELLKGKYR